MQNMQKVSGGSQKFEINVALQFISSENEFCWRLLDSRIVAFFSWKLSFPILIYRKATLEDDRQDIRRIQERFYEDGDLLSDGVGRRRNFRWRNIDRPLNDTVESVGSDNEDVDENENEPESHKEAEKRIARLEREAFLEEQRVSKL